MTALLQKSWILLAVVIAAMALAALAADPPAPPAPPAPPTPLAAVPATNPASEQRDPISPEVQQRIDRALKWLADHQAREGHWQSPQGQSTAVTSLATMAFLARGHTPGQGPYGDNVDRAINFVLDHQKDDGMLSASSQTMYDHGVSTVMLCEVYGMVDDQRRQRLDKALARAVKLILDAQKRTQGQYAGGWRYQPNSPDADISVTGWQLMALRGAANCGAAIPRPSIDAGLQFIQKCVVQSGGFAYQPGGSPNQPRTGTGILALELLGQHHAPQALAGGKFLQQHPLNNRQSEHYYYGVYYCSQAANQLGGEYWKSIYPTLRDTLLAGQQPDGSWKDGDSGSRQGGESYMTSMAVLALCVPYRYLPMYQR